MWGRMWAIRATLYTASNALGAYVLHHNFGNQFIYFFSLELFCKYFRKEWSVLLISLQALPSPHAENTVLSVIGCSCKFSRTLASDVTNVAPTRQVSRHKRSAGAENSIPFPLAGDRRYMRGLSSPQCTCACLLLAKPCFPYMY
jgi:hypothetical protein